MTEEINTAKKLIRAMADVNGLLRDHSVNLRRLPSVAKAQTSPLEAAVYKNGPGLEGHVEATLRGGDVLCWWLYVRSEGNSWSIEAVLDRTSGDQQQTVKELATETAYDFDGLLDTLKRVVGELLNLGIPGN